MKNDLISRADALALIEYMGAAYHTPTIREAMTRVENLPSADAAQVVHAGWVVNTDDFTPKKRCTHCGYNKSMIAGEGIEQEPESFCNACGATMDKEGGQ